MAIDPTGKDLSAAQRSQATQAATTSRVNARVTRSQKRNTRCTASWMALK